jgi:hypothetical protein
MVTVRAEFLKSHLAVPSFSCAIAEALYDLDDDGSLASEVATLPPRVSRTPILEFSCVLRRHEGALCPCSHTQGFPAELCLSIVDVYFTVSLHKDNWNSKRERGNTLTWHGYAS